MTLYDAEGNVITLQISDNSEVLALLEQQNEKLDEVMEFQDFWHDKILEQSDMMLHIDNFIGLIFGMVLLYGVYRFLSGVISSMFGGG